ncbi:DUF6452 family protein [Psychroserpens sp.]|uniref:DUF6452 family protein n=1 Tax=Psychroserpens sp. TaxID=2020870 RepID=UPI002B272735|nr:DUF6452 family protein [Psychroserpens sp.]
MKLKTIQYFLIIIFTVSFISCERDDICPEDVPTTPRLILEFFDISNQDNKKNVTKLFIQGVDNIAPLSGYLGDTNENTVELPLKTDDNTTSFRFIRDYAINDNGTPDDTSDDFQTGNEDIIIINYTAENVYVSRACGYKTIYKAVSVQFGEVNVTDRWIVLAQPLTDNQSIEDETTIHFKFFH